MTGSPHLPAWEVEVRSGSVADAHGPVGAFDRRMAVRHEVTGPAVVLGSGQRSDEDLEARAAAAGLPVVRRRSGGGAVLVVPGPVLWVDVLLPRGDEWWDDDVGRSSVWLGRAWTSALAALGVAARVVDGSAACGSAGRAVCFAGRAAGEVLASGRKVVGISQRRDRFGARFQCAALVGSEAVEDTVVPLVDLLGLDPSEGLVAELRATVGWVDASADALFGALLGVLGAVSR